MTAELPRTAPLGATLAMLLAVVLAWVNGLLVRTMIADVPLLGDPADLTDFRVAAGVGLATAALLVLGVLAVHVLGTPGWLQYVAGFAAATQLALGLTSWWSSRDVDNSLGDPASFWYGIAFALEVPGCWLLLLVLVIALERAIRARRS